MWISLWNGREIQEVKMAEKKVKEKKKICLFTCAAYIGIGGMRIENEPRH